MRMVKFLAAPALILGLLIGLAVVRADDPAPKYTIKQVMQMAHKGPSKDVDSLATKVVKGNGSDEDKKKLLDLYSALPDNKPPKGDAESWKTKTTAIVDAAKAVADGKEGANATLKKALDCGSCHDAHKPPKDK
jgi:cytochrome c553